jgi:hypothetical protein
LNGFCVAFGGLRLISQTVAVRPAATASEFPSAAIDTFQQG